MTRGRSRLRRGLLGLGLALVLVVGVGYAAVRATPPNLTSAGPTSVTGTAASATFTIADRQIRQVRYRDRATLDYVFRLTNGEPWPVTVTGIDPAQKGSRLFGYAGLEDADGGRRITVPARGSREAHLLLRMGGCESLSARAGSFASSVLVRTERMGIPSGSVRVRLPEEVHTGSPREAFCPNSTAKSRPAG
ncbi:MAG: hypothetical protein ABWY19_05145 [Marmoricola sp.]